MDRKGPWDVPAKPVRAMDMFHGRLKLLTWLFGAAFVGLLGYVLWIGHGYQSQPVPNSTYPDLIAAMKACPALKPHVARAMADGRVTRDEAQALATTYAGLAAAYDDAHLRQQTAAAAGAPPVAVPPVCRRDAASVPGVDG